MKIWVIVCFSYFCLMGSFNAQRVTPASADGESLETAQMRYLSADQESALKRVDAMVVEAQRQLDDLKNQRAALITGFAISDPAVSKSGLEWGSEFRFTLEQDGRHGFRKLTAEEKASRDQKPDVKK